MQPWFAALGIPFDKEEPFDTDIDNEGEWYTEWTLPQGAHLEMNPKTREQWTRSEY